MGEKVYIFDSTLRDGSQAQGISFSVSDKIKIVRALDELGIDYIEAGNPTSNPKDAEFFEKAKSELGVLKHAKLCAFGSTRKPNIKPEDDSNLKAVLSANTEVVAIFGKTWDFHVTDIIKTSLEENIEMIYSSIKYLKENGKEVVFDAEHFFDGYKNNAKYAVKVLEAAKNAGADWMVLCDTNGGTMPLELQKIISNLNSKGFSNLGIHCHNDTGMAVANSIVSVETGVRHVQGTLNGFGERCGNANLSTIMANLSLKLDYATISNEMFENLFTTCRYVNEVSNLTPNEREPYVGSCAFAHKGGMHIDGVNKNPTSFEHISPDVVGNSRKFLMSEVSGRSTIMSIIHKVNSSIDRGSAETSKIVNRLKELEYRGYQFEGAESSLELMIRKELGLFEPSFELVEYKVIMDNPSVTDKSALVVMKIMVNGVMEVTAADGMGPVNALDTALRKALSVFYKSISTMHLSDYKVRVIDGDAATSAQVRVIIESTDGVNTWTTVGVSHDIIEASWKALVDSVEYKLIKG